VLWNWNSEAPSSIVPRDANANLPSVKYIIMDEEELNQELRNLAERILPELPKTFKAGIGKSIRAGSSPGRERWVDGLVAILLKPHWAALALLITVGIGATFGRTFAGSDARKADSSLGLNVFAGDAPALPSTLLTRPR